MADPHAEYLRTTRADISRLPQPLALAAKVHDYGQAQWPRDMAEEAIRALVHLGRVVNVLEYARYAGGELVEQNPLSTYEGNSAEANLRYILPGLARLPDDTSAVVFWYPGD